MFDKLPVLMLLCQLDIKIYICKKKGTDMKFRPCIDIHNGSVKQIVGGSLKDEGDLARENFVSGRDAAFFSKLYREYELSGGHIILLNPVSSPYYEETKRQALSALSAYPGGMQAGGGITPENAADFLKAGASHVIVTSYVFSEGQIRYDKLDAILKEVGKERLVLDLSVRSRDGRYYIVTDRWQKYTSVELNEQTLDMLSYYCGEFLIHAVDVEGKSAGIEESVAKLLGDWGKIPVTYAGGVHSFADLDRLRQLGRGRVDVTIGSALDLFGGNMAFQDVMAYMEEKG